MPRHAAYKQTWKRGQDAVYWIDICRAQRMGLKFFQTRSNARVLHDTLPPKCIAMVVSRKSEQVLYTKNVSRRFAPTMTFKGKWKKDWDSDAAASSNSSQPSQPKQWAKTGQPVVQNSGTLDFRIQELLHSKTEEAEQGRVRDLINQIESHSYQDDLQSNLKQNTVTFHSAQIRWKWSTNLETWNTLNFAKWVPGCNALIVSLVG